MRATIQDPLWPEFASLWAEFGVFEPPVLLSGGYGLFLKQLFLTAQPEVATTVPLERWNGAPRSTRDLDFLLDVQLIAQPQKQKEIRAALDARAYTPLNPFWQFQKELGPNQVIHVDLLAPLPDVPGVRSDGSRVKSQPSLGALGVHAHQTREAIGCGMHPFGFEWNGVSLRVPNPVSWCVMKLCATRDRWERAQNVERDATTRAEQRDQALKHAGDVLRLAAMMTREERAQAREVVAVLREEEVFQDAAQVAQKFFLGADAVMLTERAVAGVWARDDLETIRGVLSSWLPV